MMPKAARPLVVLAAILSAASARAADVQLICPPSLRPVVTELAPAFESASGHHLSVRWEVMPTMKRQIDAGAVFDVAILTPDLMDDAIAKQRLDASSRAIIARTGAGL